MNNYLLRSIALLCLLVSALASHAQTIDIGCATDRAMEDFYQKHPEARKNAQELEIFSQQFIKNFARREGESSFVIPVVFHVNDISDPYKVTMEQLRSAIDILNEDFNALNDDFSSIDPAFDGIAANVGIEFQLARFDPNGSPTNGVTYHFNNFTGREPDGTGRSIKEISYWPGDKYLNVWICNEVEERGVFNNSGWAYLPDNDIAAQGLDGIVYNWRYLGRPGVGSSRTEGQEHIMRVLTHEVGHFLNLHHTFRNGCSGSGDNVDDTPATQQAAGCARGTQSCGHIINSENYMDYNSCPKMFTEGQKSRMIAALNANVADRNNLWTMENLESTLGIGSGGGFIDYSAIQFKESNSNDGSFDGSAIVSLSEGSEFSITNGPFIQGTHFEVENLPEGLTMTISVNSITEAEITLSGNTDNHANTDDIANLKVTFLNASFSGSTTIVNPVNDDLILDFKDPFNIVYDNIADLKVTQSETWEPFNFGVGNGNYGIFYNSETSSFQLETYTKDAITLGSTRNILLLEECEMIDENRSFTAGGDYPNLHDVYNDNYREWLGKTGYVGIRFQIGSDVHYGWLKLQVSNTGNSLTLLEHAYNQAPGQGLRAGQRAVSETLSSEKDVVSFTIDGQIGDAEIDANNGTINVSILNTTDLTDLETTIKTTACAEVSIGSSETIDLSSGEYSFTVTAEDGSQKEWIIQVAIITGTEKPLSPQLFNIYPNPSNGTFTYQVDKRVAIKVVWVFNTLGQSVFHSSNHKKQEGFIDISDNPKGIYILKIFTDEGVIERKLLKTQ
ncbi:zinc-dependent metalloprotease [Fulvivirgaceae bacterium BMA10]|uniref:Zinc-dependent metalloprotease n=1 Tax=Splendidivirga corallicola TaxID=3051826 RepID=A0ABT8KNL6_9BACT|nr:zinc-dependent metalloprotease [Fulvivirgaceae bacterium BMA10]